jgi:divalent metal cation (Fe/Co/Zn/Cd) transporter
MASTAFLTHALLEHHRSQFVDFHDIKTRRSGTRVFAEFHLLVDPSLTVQEVHDFTEKIEDEIRNEMPEV